MKQNSHNSIFCENVDLIISRIEADASYTRVFLDTYPLSEAQVARLASAIEKSTSIVYLNIFGCHIDEKKAAVLLLAFKKNQSLEEIVIDQDLISKRTYEEIISSIGKNKNGRLAKCP